MDSYSEQVTKMTKNISTNICFWASLSIMKILKHYDTFTLCIPICGKFGLF